MGYGQTFGNRNVEVQLNGCENLTSTGVEYNYDVETNQIATNELAKVSQCSQLECTARLRDGKIDADNSSKLNIDSETPTSMSMAGESTNSDQKLTFNMLMNIIYVDGEVQAVPRLINDDDVTGINNMKTSKDRAEIQLVQNVCKNSDGGTEAENREEVLLQTIPGGPGHSEDRLPLNPTSSTLFEVTAL